MWASAIGLVGFTGVVLAEIRVPSVKDPAVDLPHVSLPVAHIGVVDGDILFFTFSHFLCRTSSLASRASMTFAESHNAPVRRLINSGERRRRIELFLLFNPTHVLETCR